VSFYSLTSSFLLLGCYSAIPSTFRTGRCIPGGRIRTYMEHRLDSQDAPSKAASVEVSLQ